MPQEKVVTWNRKGINGVVDVVEAMNNHHHRLIVSEELGANDVLLGRGTGPNEHIGNGKFRNLVAEEVISKPRVEGQQKTELAFKVLKAVTAKGGKFVKKYTVKSHNGRKGKRDVYVEVPVRVAVEKTRQTIRYMLDHRKEPISCTNCSKYPTTISSKIRSVHDANANTMMNDSDDEYTLLSIKTQESAAQTLLEFSKGAADAVMHKKQPSSSAKFPYKPSPSSNVSLFITDRGDLRDTDDNAKNLGRNELLASLYQPSDIAETKSFVPRQLKAPDDDTLRVMLDSRNLVLNCRPRPIRERPFPDLRCGFVFGQSDSVVNSQERISFSSYDTLVASTHRSVNQLTPDLRWFHLLSPSQSRFYFPPLPTSHPYPSESRIIHRAFLRGSSELDVTKAVLQEEVKHGPTITLTNHSP